MCSERRRGYFKLQNMINELEKYKSNYLAPVTAF